MIRIYCPNVFVRSLPQTNELYVKNQQGYQRPNRQKCDHCRSKCGPRGIDAREELLLAVDAMGSCDLIYEHSHGYDENNQDIRSQTDQESQEIPVVPFGDAVTGPWAMVVEFFDAILTC